MARSLLIWRPRSRNSSSTALCESGWGPFIWTHASTMALTIGSFLAFASSEVLGMPPMFIVMLLGALGCSFLLHQTRFGRDLRAIGSSEVASRMAGLAVDRTRIAAFVVFGLLTSAAGIGLASLLSSASANMSIGYELNVVAIAVVGGTSLFGGGGTLLGTVTGAVLFAALDNALNLLKVSSYWRCRCFRHGPKASRT